jgi:endonuclease III
MSSTWIATKTRSLPRWQAGAAILRILKRLFPHATMALHWRTPWQCMVAVQLSAQCTDKKVNEVTATLFKKYRTLDDYVRAKPKEFERDIHSTGFYHNKTKNILAAAKLVKEKWHGKLPCTMAGMLTIPGVARKTANVVLGNVCGVVEGIAVDTHVIRLSRAWGLTKHTDPKKIERDLMALFPKKEWFPLTYRIIDYGRKYAPATKKDHSGEPLGKFYIVSK